MHCYLLFSKLVSTICKVLFHTAHKRNDESAMMEQHQKVTDSVEDQLCLAAIQYLRIASPTPLVKVIPCFGHRPD